MGCSRDQEVDIVILITSKECSRWLGYQLGVLCNCCYYTPVQSRHIGTTLERTSTCLWQLFMLSSSIITVVLSDFKKCRSKALVARVQNWKGWGAQIRDCPVCSCCAHLSHANESWHAGKTFHYFSNCQNRKLHQSQDCISVQVQGRGCDWRG